MRVKSKFTNRRLAEFDVSLVSGMTDIEVDALAENLERYHALLGDRGERIPSITQWLVRMLRKESRRRKIADAEPGLWELDRGCYAEDAGELGLNLFHLFGIISTRHLHPSQVVLLSEILHDLIFLAKSRLEDYANLQYRIEYSRA